MIKRSAIFFVLGLVVGTSYGQVVSESAARIVGATFLTSTSASPNARSRSDLELVYTANSGSESIPSTGVANPYFYVFNATGGSGFVIVSGNERLRPVLAYSGESVFDPANIPPNVAKWLEGYKTEARYVTNNLKAATKEIQSEWSALLSGEWNDAPFNQTTTVNPLIQTKWNQAPNYNALCPFDTEHNTKTVTGCVATSMAQIMKFWNYPPAGTGFHSYNHETYGTLSANFGTTTYQWASMPNIVNTTNTAVATLMYHCGVSVDMNYGPGVTGGSSASHLAIVSALKTYFGYPASVQEKIRSNYTEAGWKNLIKTELDAGRPIEYAGSGSGGGHSFVCDGYDNNDFFHFNWGWGGNSDGYFSVNALNPPALGDGGGTGGFNSGQRVIIGIQPPGGVSTTYDMRLYSAVTINPDPIAYNAGFTVTVNVANFGTTAANNFTGDYTAAVFNSNNQFVAYVETKTGYSLPFGNHYVNPLVFTSSGSQAMTPGEYKVGIYYKPTGSSQWSAFADGSYENFISVQVEGNSSNPLKLYAAITTTPSTIIQGQPLTIHFDVANMGTSTFTGDISVDIHKSDGSWIRELSKKTGLSLSANNHYLNGLTYTLPTGLADEPGTYQLFVWNLPSGGAWDVLGSGSYSNPINILVVAPTLAADIYETNNTVAQAYNLAISFTGNNATKNTTGSNCNTGTDYDYYKINLPAGFDYTVNPRLHDSNNSANGLSYTLDALFSYSTNGTTWSGPYDDLIDGVIGITGGGTIYFHVAPFFSGEKGTYLLDMSITRVLCGQAAPLALSATSLTTTSFIARWSAASGAGGYELDVSADNFATFIAGYNSKSISGSSTVTDNVAGLTHGTSYKYRVRAVGTCKSINSNVIDAATPSMQFQVITFNPVADNTMGNPAFSLTATSTSALDVTFTTTSANIAISGSQVTLVKAGRTVITARQEGNSSFLAATAVDRSFCIKPVKPTITISEANTVSPTLTSSASSGNTWYKNGNSISGTSPNTLKVTSAGIYKVQVLADDCLSAFSSDFPIIITGDLHGSSMVTSYPNPAQDFIEVSGLNAGVHEAQILDMGGRGGSLLLESKDEVHRADVRHLSQGLYLLIVPQGTSVYLIRFIKQ